MPNGYEYLGGSSRRYANIKTGEIISRYQYDKLFGSTKEFGGNTHLKAKLNKLANPDLAAQRPAPGRKGKAQPADRWFSKGLNLSPVDGKKSQHVVIPVKYSGGSIDFIDLAPKYISFVKGLKENLRVYGASINITFSLSGRLDTKNLFKLHVRRAIPSIGEFEEAINLYYEDPQTYKVSGESLSDLRILSVDFYIVFTANAMKG